jgi:tetratricopeptide (TPR) repeat protein/predicted Ser/Thr protein kinase
MRSRRAGSRYARVCALPWAPGQGIVVDVGVGAVDTDSQSDVPTRVAVDTSSSVELLNSASDQPLHAPLLDLLKAQVERGAGGARLGRYALLRVLGEGGMGVVFAAYDEELDRKVAIKLLRTQGGAAPERSWLLSEAKAMARLSHPNIVQVYDVGTCDGQLFLAMEFVVGVTLRDWLRERPRDWREVVAVCLQAGRGLQAAHEAGLVHRDFKPHNVLVGGDGRVRVLDFGLAQLQRRDRTRERADGEHTRTVLAGTPAYMAPELHLRGEPDARSDQFAFCVSVHEALYGKRPFAAADPQGLATAILTGTLTPPPVDARVPAWLRKIVLRGLAGDPADRWPSMDALLTALGRDRARTVRRWLLAGAGLGLAALLAANIVQRQAQAAELEAHRCDALGGLDEVWGPAHRTAVRAAIVGSGLSYAADTWDRVAARLDDYAARWGEARVQACEDHRSGAQSDLLHELRVACLEQRRGELAALVDVYSSADAAVVGKAVKAAFDLRPLAPCADVDKLLSRVVPPGSPEAAEEVARLRLALAGVRAETTAGRHTRASELYAAAEPAIAATGYPPLQAEAALLAGMLADALGDYKTAATRLEDALWTAEIARHEAVATEAAIRLYFVTGYRLTKIEEAALWERHAAAALARRFRPDLEIRLMSTRSTVAARAGKPDDARVLGEQALARASEVNGPRHPEVASLLNNLGSFAGARGDHAKASEYFTQSLALVESLFGPEHPDVAIICGNAGSAALASGDHVRAEQLLTRALELTRRALGPEHPEIARIYNNLAGIHTRTGNYAPALALHEQALALRRKLLGELHADTANSASNAGDALLHLGRPAEARALFEQALAGHRATVGEDHPRHGATTAYLGVADVALGRTRQGIAELERGIAIMTAVPDPPLEHLGDARFALAQALWPRDKPRALEQARQAREHFAAVGPVCALELTQADAWLASHR